MTSLKTDHVFSPVGDAVPVCAEAVPVEEDAHFVLTQQKQEDFEQLMLSYEVQPFFQQKMRALLCGRKKVFVIDNSGSMNTGLSSSPLQKERPGQVITRMDELAHFVKKALPILTLDSPEGVDFWFLNDSHGRTGPFVIRGVHQFHQVETMLARGFGLTPLIQTVHDLLKVYRSNACEEGVHVLVATDGAPNEGIEEGGRLLQQMLSNRPCPYKFVFNFLVCTDVEAEVEYLDRIDKQCPNVDVIDDFDAERRQILSKKTVKTFSQGDYIVKAIVGGADAEIDRQDETPPSSMHRKTDGKVQNTLSEPIRKAPQPRANAKSCCIIL